MSLVFFPDYDKFEEKTNKWMAKNDARYTKHIYYLISIWTPTMIFFQGYKGDIFFLNLL
jgi:hypothetical protein